jgi:hypothetical protein
MTARVEDIGSSTLTGAPKHVMYLHSSNVNRGETWGFDLFCTCCCDPALAGTHCTRTSALCCCGECHCANPFGPCCNLNLYTIDEPFIHSIRGNPSRLPALKALYKHWKYITRHVYEQMNKQTPEGDLPSSRELDSPALDFPAAETVRKHLLCQPGRDFGSLVADRFSAWGETTGGFGSELQRS